MIKKEIFELLDSKIVDFFPKEGNWKSNCFRREKLVSENNLPCHLRNVDWLTSLIIKKYNLYSLEKSIIKEYVKNSEYFNKMRSEYEQKIVKWQINWMRSGGGNWIVESGNDEFLLSERCDYIFRKGIVDTLLAIGMNINAIEEGIEKNADMWLESLMNLAFDNKYNPLFSNFRITLEGLQMEDESDEKLQSADSTFKDCWLKYRRYQYYQEHKKSVDAYGIITPDMKMDEEEVKKLKNYLKKQKKIRLEEIENFRNIKKHEKLSELKEMRESDFYSLSYEDCLIQNCNDGKIKKKLRKTLRKIIH